MRGREKERVFEEKKRRERGGVRESVFGDEEI